MRITRHAFCVHVRTCVVTMRPSQLSKQELTNWDDSGNLSRLSAPLTRLFRSGLQTLMGENSCVPHGIQAQGYHSRGFAASNGTAKSSDTQTLSTQRAHAF